MRARLLVVFQRLISAWNHRALIAGKDDKPNAVFSTEPSIPILSVREVFYHRRSVILKFSFTPASQSQLSSEHSLP